MFFKKAVLIIHGFVGGTYDNENLATYLQYQGGLDVYDFTLPGHDRSYIGNVKHQDWIIASEQKLEFLARKYKTIYIVGHSMGGVIATHLAAKYPQVKKLILVAPAFEYASLNQNKKDLKNIVKIMKDSDNPDAYRLTLSKAGSVPITTIIEFTKLVKQNKSDIKNVNIPTLILRGEIDEVIPQKSAQYAYDNVKTTYKYLTIIENVRHAVFRSKRHKEVSAYVYKFIKGGLRWTISYKSKI